MTSDILYLGRVSTPRDIQTIPADRWYSCDNIEKSIKTLPFDLALRVLLDQAIAAAYLKDLYGTGNELQIDAYIDDLCSIVTFWFLVEIDKKIAENTSFSYNMSEMIDTLRNLTRYLKGTDKWTDVDVNLVSQFITSVDDTFVGMLCYPVATADKASGYQYRSYLYWKNAIVPEAEYTITDATSLMTPSYLPIYNTDCMSCGPIANYGRDPNFVGYCVNFGVYPIGTAFSGGMQIKNHFFCNCAILNYLAHFDLSSIEFERLVGLLAQFCISKDVYHRGITSTHALAYKLMCKLQNIKDFSGSHVGVEVEELPNSLHCTLVDFVKFATETYCMSVSNPDITAMVFHALANTTEERRASDFLLRSGAKTSVDQAKAFESLMGSVEALKLISQTTSLISAQSQVTDEADSGKEEGGDKGADSKPAEADKGAAKGTKSETPKQDEADDTVDENEEDAEQEDQEQNDTPEEEDAGGESEEETGDEGENQDASSDDTGSGDSSMPQDNKPTEPNLSDEKGIEIKVSLPDTETVSSVLVREELDKLLSNILVNPPKDMSPQGIATLTALKRYWVHTLSIETILGILEAHVELPASIKKSSKLHGVKNNE